MSKREAYEAEMRVLEHEGKIASWTMPTIRAYVTDLEQQLKDAHEALAVSAEMRADILEKAAREAWDAAREGPSYDPVGDDFYWEYMTFSDWKRNRGGK